MVNGLFIAYPGTDNKKNRKQTLRIFDKKTGEE